MKKHVTGPDDPDRYYTDIHSDSWGGRASVPHQTRPRTKPQYHPSTYLECLTWRWGKRLKLVFQFALWLAVFAFVVFGLISLVKQ